MGEATYQQTAFLGGEWSLSMQGRADRPDYRMAMNSCINSLPIDTGAWTRRPGFKHGAVTRGGLSARVLSFAFQENMPYTLEFTDSHIRAYQDAVLAKTNDAQAILSISSASPAVVTTTTAHGWATGDQGIFTALGTFDPLLQNRTLAFTVTGATTLTIADAITGTAINGASLVTFVSGTLARILDVASPYIGGDWATLRSVQAETRTVLLHGSYAPRLLTATALPTESAYATFSLASASFLDGPYLDPVGRNALLTPSAASGIINLVISFPAWSSTAVYTTGDFVTYSTVTYQSLADQNLNLQPDTHSSQWAVVSPAKAVGPNGFVGSDVGRHIRLNSEPAVWAAGTTYAAGATVTYGAYTYWTSLLAGNVGNVPGVDLVHWGVNARASNWTWGKITALLNLIAANVAGVAHIGNMTDNGGLAAGFNGVADQAATACADHAASRSCLPGTVVTNSSFIGQNYSGTVATAYAISSAIFTPSSDRGIAYAVSGSVNIATNLVVNLRGSNTTPGTDPTAGTLLGSYDFGTSAGSNPVTLGTAPVTILSNDLTTTYKYVWFEITAVSTNVGAIENTILSHVYCGQAQFFTTAGVSNAGVTVEILGPALLNTNAVRTWRLGVYSDATGWPTNGTYHEGRLWLAGSVGNRFDASQPLDSTKTEINFAPTEIDGTVTDASAISYTFRASGVNTIFWMKPDQQGIICGTQAGEWLVQASALNSPLTVLNIQAHRVTTIGCANIEPAYAEHTTVFVQKFKHKLMEYFADVYSGKFSAPNLSLTAKHLATRGIEQVAYQQELTPIVWARCTDGSLIGVSYKRESLQSSQGPTAAGWHQHTHGAGRVVESLCTGPSTDGLLDTLAVVTNDTDSGTRHVEFLTNLWEEGTDISEAQYCDDAIVPSMTQNVVLGGVSSFQLCGLWPHNGETVTVFAGGIDCGDHLVTNGACSVPFGSDAGGLFTPAFVAAFGGDMPVIAGFTYTSRGQLLRPATPADSGSRNGPAFGKFRRIEQVAFQFVDTQGLSFGTSFSKMTPAALKTAGGTALARNVLFSGIFRDTVRDESNYDGMICWEITRPLPATIVAAGGFIQTQDA